MVFYFIFEVFFLKKPNTLIPRSHLVHVLKPYFLWVSLCFIQQPEQYPYFGLRFCEDKEWAVMQQWATGPPEEAFNSTKFVSDSGQSVTAGMTPGALITAHSAGTGRGCGGAECRALGAHICAGSRWHLRMGKNRTKARMCNCFFGFVFW